MARFFSHDEIVTRELTPIEDIQWLAGQVAGLPPFAEGAAVLCGSVSWGKHSWRSDLDVVHFSTIAHPHVEQAVKDVVQQYLDRTGNRYIAPRVDVITIGAESLTLAKKSKSLSGSNVSVGGAKSKKPVADVFMETAVLFADHIGSIADLKGNPWRAFFDRHLASVNGNRTGRREAIKSYVERMAAEWARQPLHRLSLGPDGQFTAEHLDLVSKTENYPVNLMRRILGDLGRYPRPDRASDVREAFSALEEPWAKALLERFEPFFLLDGQYEEIVAACKRADSPLAAADYYERIRSLFVDLPYTAIQDGVWEYIRS